MIHRQRAKNRPHHGVYFIATLTDEAEAGLRAQAQNLSDVTDPALLHNEVPQGSTSHRFKFLSDGNLGPLHRYRGILGRLKPDAKPDVEEVRVRAVSLPHPRSTDDGFVFAGIPVNEQAVAAFLLRRTLDLIAVLVELPQIDSPLLLLFTPTDPSGAPESATEH